MQGTWAKGVGAGVLLTGAVWGLVLAGQLWRPVPNNQWVEQAYVHKLAIAAAIHQPKLLVVAGSAAMFGIDSAQLEQALGRPVVNLGVNAGILSSYIQHYARQAMKPGDWMLLPLEYPLYHDRFAISQPFVDYWWEHPGFRRLGVNAGQLAQVIWATPLSRVLQGYRSMPAGFVVSGLYGPQNLDARGDQLNSDASQQQAPMLKQVEQSPQEHYGAKANGWNANWSSWKSLADDVSAGGGCAVFVPPPMLDRAGYHQGEEGRYYASLPEQARAQGLDYRGSPLHTLYPQERFFDTNYHLNAAARSLYTRYLITQVKAVFQAPGCTQ